MGAATQFVETQLDETYPDGIGNHFWNHARNQIIAARIAEWGLPKDARILEVGCGRGVVVRYLRGRGFDCLGAELSDSRVDDDLAGFVQMGVDCFELPLAFREGISALMLLDVIEHLPDPAGFMSRLRDSFPNARFLLVTVPARKELWSNYDDYYGHFRRYDTDMLRGQFSDAGLRPLRVGYMFRALYPVMFLLSRIAGKRQIKQSTPSHIWAHRILARLFVWEYSLLPAGLPGTSVIGAASLAPGVR
jgi:hypothetical protein